jgi:hypothetical protein
MLAIEIPDRDLRRWLVHQQLISKQDHNLGSTATVQVHLQCTEGFHQKLAVAQRSMHDSDVDGRVHCHVSSVVVLPVVVAGLQGVLTQAHLGGKM